MISTICGSGDTNLCLIVSTPVAASRLYKTKETKTTCVARGVAKAERSSWVLRALRKSMKRRGGRNASGDGPTFASSLYRDGGLDRG